jgi:precorrin-3B C17-methyltransferase
MAKITVVGLGPGSLLDMTPRALQAIEQAEVVAGYNTYIKLIEELLEDGSKEVIGTGMMQEIDRCRMAVEIAASGKETVVVSSGDAGVYGMAGLVLELILKLPEEKRPEWGGVVVGV